MNGICIDVFSGFEYDELLPMIKNIGFDGFFTDHETANSPEKMAHVRNLADKLGLEYETSHATIPGCDTIWSDQEIGEEYLDVLMRNIDNCHVNSVPILVVHVQPYVLTASLELGLERLDRAVKYAKAKNVKIAFENINSAEFLFAVMDYFKDDDNVGFCYDCGHEAFYTPDVRCLEKLGDRLICTHLHDNNKTYDEHLIPFDSDIDFDLICDELRACKYQGNITLELHYLHDEYKGVSKYEFLQKSFDAANKLKNKINV
jgi:sugar phosphate isomerase/epimerase